MTYIAEIKVRLFYILTMLVCTFITCYIFKEPIIYILIKPLLTISTQYFIFTNLIEIFIMYLKILLIISLYLIIPFILYQIWLFLVPGLYLYEKVSLKYFFYLIILTLCLGITIAYYLIIPIAWKFFISFETKGQNLFSIHYEAKINEYLMLILNILLTISFCFQFPLYILLLINFNILDISWFYKKRKIAYILILIFAAIISPPDLFSQILLFTPLIILYELTIFYSLLFKEYQLNFL